MLKISCELRRTFLRTFSLLLRVSSDMKINMENAPSVAVLGGFFWFFGWVASYSSQNNFFCNVHNTPINNRDPHTSPYRHRKWGCRGVELAPPPKFQFWRGVIPPPPTLPTVYIMNFITVLQYCLSFALCPLTEGNHISLSQNIFLRLCNKDSHRCICMP